LAEDGLVTTNPSSDTVAFTHNLDLVGGNSGSPILDPLTRVVEGIEVAGNTDFVLATDGQGTCFSSRVCSASTGCPGFESASRTIHAASHIPLTAMEIVPAVGLLL
jgi:hypothetical protein